MPDYSKAVIYTIRTGDCLYVGSTCNYTNRKYQHKNVIKTHQFKLYSTIRENNGEWDMKPYSQFPCENKTQLIIEEERVRQLLNSDLNSNRCHTSKEYIKQNRKKSVNDFIITKCECGCDVKRYNMKRHKTTNKHMNLMKSIDPAKIGLH